ncbi:malate dehydrogenase [Methanococcoides alaskense]|uniref:Malate dehydrogenase n=1 Tax=Methanococcoides alaskense TaxID=325778 RepID=A0AA90TXG9_9EURY|nr:malate dehydrogenase [Methanococcoides alaskense]MDA0525299.1 malate dehydrogenase [Methanococcoides alaskense]MDR6221777.1 malate dehydrogenase [Methanococcoides alaskense]
MKKISVIGSGNVGSTTVQRLAELELGDIVMTDVVEGLPEGKALDIIQAAPVLGYNVDILGTTDYADIADSDVVIITAGIARKKGMMRDDLMKINANIIRDVSENISQYAPEAIVITVSNPLDVMTYATQKYTGLEHDRVFGMSGVLDSSRFAAFIAMELGISVRDVSALVLGGHGDSLVALPQYTTVSGVPISKLLPEETIDRLIQRTINAGTEIVEYLKTGSAFYAPAAAIATMVEAVIKDQKRVLPAAAYLQGEYNENDLYLGVPVILGKNGVEEVLELELTESQQQAFSISAKSVRDGIGKLQL